MSAERYQTAIVPISADIGATADRYLFKDIRALNQRPM